MSSVPLPVTFAMGALHESSQGWIGRRLLLVSMTYCELFEQRSILREERASPEGTRSTALSTSMFSGRGRGAILGEIRSGRNRVSRGALSGLCT